LNTSKKPKVAEVRNDPRRKGTALAVPQSIASSRALDSLLEIKRKRAKAYLSKRVLVEFIWQGLGSRFE
jgi:hypothetical protein